MSEIQSFQFHSFQIRSLGTALDPWFVAKDVCDVLEVGNSRDALSRLDEDEKGVASIDTLGGKQEMSIISESGLYSLVLTSRKPQAKEFKRWITHEVIPSIRKTGSYSIQPMTQAQILAASAQLLVELEQRQLEQERRQREIEAQMAGIMQVQAEAHKELIALPPSSHDIPPESTDMKIRRVVNNYCASTGLNQSEAYRSLYQQHYYRYRRIVTPLDRESKLKAFIRLGLIDSLYDLAVELFVRSREVS